MPKILSVLSAILMALFFTAVLASRPVANKIHRPSSEISKRRLPRLESRGEGGSYEGYATFFHPATEGGSTGACGPQEDDNSQIVALNLDQFGYDGPASDWCFKEVLIKSGDRSTVATIQDACPGCRYHSLDLTPSVFLELSNLNIGIIPIEWCILGEGDCSTD
ncbi:hypothetical protein J3Q64DRAFT_1752106 [Phycomyces blakesleeanus]|uniref:RlpA-like protein double-psi beta-barrel domain-containing protein n=2 Tax=Phycomyces blakesleeanus TaxID=4837 RepID=A0A167MH56_PHYB8|nr:hypothetical protein PHYBLDRAFT_65247 [Phycomyces blakesleeanus NRRL 1555(-)]OAD72829.1 hypothetical protein PHYBLDRAFT_65247 [Phycomyces blakesleeanus NRRL 1555(-)]|eukprot:XP_018290869.1 hypothetical protein PHYBLDRAFT_65247 [Phycomyces blakesleeanus NRRL 1555(-)]